MTARDPTPAAALNMAPTVAGSTLCVHAWQETADGSEYADPETPGARGCAYLRFATPAGPGDFDSLFEVDFRNLGQAERFAADYSARHGVPVFSY